MAVKYDENVILTFTGRLYRRATSMMIAYALLGALIGVAAGMGIATANRTPELIPNFAVALGVVSAVIGGMIGRDRAFALRLMAQQALCQVQIERNTRSPAPAAASATEVNSRPPPPSPANPRRAGRRVLRRVVTVKVGARWRRRFRLKGRR
ncbi:MAG TPA: hypothetical protein VNO30_15880 [Kofleriaceae bacterium]|nr:hypothetical protein [Kofleriaceae bacterium]